MKKAKQRGVCPDGYKQLRSLSDKGEMVDLYIRYIDFCLSNDFPDNNYILKHFAEVTPAKGIFVNQQIALCAVPRVVALGDTRGSIRLQGYNVCEIFAKHTSRLCVEAGGNAYVMVDMFDNSHVSVRCSDNAKVYVTRYGGRLSHSPSPQIIVSEKGRDSY